MLEGAAKCSPKHRLLVENLLKTGLRVSELHKLDIRDMDPDGHHLRVNNGKGGKDRIVPLSGSLYQQNRLFLGDRRAEPIFEKVTVRTALVRANQFAV